MSEKQEACYWSLIQFATDFWGDDHISAGMIALDVDGTDGASAFLTKWDRVEAFAGGDISAFRRWCDELAVGCSRVGFVGPFLTVAELRQQSRDNQNLFRITWPRKVERSSREWVDMMAPVYVRDLARAADPGPQGETE